MHALNIEKSLATMLQTNNLPSRHPQHLIKFCLSYAEFISPDLFSLEPARMLKLLAEHDSGLGREELLELFYSDYQVSSVNRKKSLRLCMEKIIQRSRNIFARYNLTIYYCPNAKRYYSLPLGMSSAKLHHLI